MSGTVTPKQALIVWCLLGRHGHARQAEIIPRIERKDREALVSAGYITSEKRSGSLSLTVEDKGWNWAGQHLRDELPPNFQVLQNWLIRVHQHLEKSGQTLADFIGPHSEKGSEESPLKGSTSRKGCAVAGKKPSRAMTKSQLRARIEKAYLVITNGRKAVDALLSKVRAELSDLDRATVDAGLLRILQGDKKARLIQISDPKAISQEEREAAFSPGGEPFHVLWIQP
jgi:hypothetical protein